MCGKHPAAGDSQGPKQEIHSTKRETTTQDTDATAVDTQYM